MNILKELTKNFQYEENMINPDMRKLISGPFRDILVSKNGICYSRSGKVMKISKTGAYRSLDHHHGHAIQPWRLCALVWHDQSPSLHLDQENIDKYLNLLSFIEVLKNYGDEYELLMDGLKTDYFPLSQREVFNVSTGCLGQATGPFKINHPNEYRKIKWGYFVEIGDQIKLDFQDFKNELSWELEKNLKNETVPDTEDVETVEIEPKEEFDICISDPELGGAPSLIPKTKTDNSNSEENNKMEAQEQPEEVQVDTKVSASIDELQELFDRRAQLKKELAKIDEQIKEML